MVYLLGEIAILLGLAVLLGIVIGWLLWRWRQRITKQHVLALTEERDEQDELISKLKADNTRLEEDFHAVRSQSARAIADRDGMEDRLTSVLIENSRLVEQREDLVRQVTYLPSTATQMPIAPDPDVAFAEQVAEPNRKDSEVEQLADTHIPASDSPKKTQADANDVQNSDEDTEAALASNEDLNEDIEEDLVEATDNDLDLDDDLDLDELDLDDPEAVLDTKELGSTIGLDDQEPDLDNHTPDEIDLTDTPDSPLDFTDETQPDQIDLTPDSDAGPGLDLADATDSGSPMVKTVASTTKQPEVTGPNGKTETPAPAVSKPTRSKTKKQTKAEPATAVEAEVDPEVDPDNDIENDVKPEVEAEATKEPTAKTAAVAGAAAAVGTATGAGAAAKLADTKPGFFSRLFSKRGDSAPQPEPLIEVEDLDIFSPDSGKTPHASSTPGPKQAAPKPATEETVTPTEPAQDKRDDLTRVNEITPALEIFLHNEDIWTYRQLGSLTDTDIDELQDKLPEHPDIIRDQDWVEQARRLYNEKFS